MNVFMDGYIEVLNTVGEMTTGVQLREQMRVLYGTDYLPAYPTYHDLKVETVRQVQLDWLNSEHPDYHAKRRSLINANYRHAEASE